jgi:hypothetical protein
MILHTAWGLVIALCVVWVVLALCLCAMAIYFALEGLTWRS